MAFTRKDSKKPKQPAKSYGLWLLSKREYSAQQLSDKFLSKGYSPEEASSAISALQALGFQSDSRFAEMKIRNNAHKAGNRKVAMTLSQAGIDSELISSSLAEAEPEASRVLSAVRKFEGKELTPDLRLKVWRFLASRGFGSKAISLAVNHLQTQELENK